MALGAAKMAAKYGSVDKAAHSKGLEMPAYDPRGNYGMGLAYATSERGACHLRAFPLLAKDPFKLKDLAREVIDGQNANAVKWSMCFCDFWGTVDTTIMADLLTAGLGRQVSAEDLDKVGERIWNLNRLFNIRAGFTAGDDCLPKKLTQQRLKDGPHDGRVLSEENLAEMRSLYYHFRGWDGEGRPGERKLRELSLQGL
jgi:aldehyde:ferredoxin oxidoreductase